MTREEFSEALGRLVVEAKEAGLDPAEILAEMAGMAEAMRLVSDEY